jgi:hypothetical protein
MVEVVQAALADKGSDIMQTVADYWIEQGVEQGRIQNVQDNILDLIDVRFSGVNEALKGRVMAVSDPTLLRQLHLEAATAVSLAAFMETLVALTASE